MPNRIPKNKLFVAMAGNIGSGKTTAAQLIAETFGFEIFHEPVKENRFLADYYENMKRWSFTLNLEFLMKRVAHVEAIAKNQNSCVQDRTLAEDPEVFVRYFYGLGLMERRELDLYFEYVNLLREKIPSPDKVILLLVPDENLLLERVKSRGRPEEKKMTVDYLAGLNHYYKTIAPVFENTYKSEVLTLDVSKIDIRAGDGKAMFLDKVETFLNA